ncbi:hypothetical protein BU23DRAFT_468511 [Bimuria novae-zelandiae CBS 107.79]|uniref:Uncharacterized protein n=1 Tax=Bimuria novae-zelandiae CBS 107.79 TaxID=1447943 RepID=A0A6A5VG71_9PLEO|nr:hypothetical protein BU23DRAFT_468511 [Bimuria novae-zelandiae CBS 107.79]
MSIIRRFSFVVPSLTRHSYSEYKSVHTTSGIDGRPRRSVLILSIVKIAIVILMLLIILYVSNARTLLVTRLHLVKL